MALGASSATRVGRDPGRVHFLIIVSIAITLSYTSVNSEAQNQHNTLPARSMCVDHFCRFRGSKSTPHTPHAPSRRGPCAWITRVHRVIELKSRPKWCYSVILEENPVTPDTPLTISLHLLPSTCDPDPDGDTNVTPRPKWIMVLQTSLAHEGSEQNTRTRKGRERHTHTKKNFKEASAARDVLEFDTWFVWLRF
jgi:hypothetical protein